MFPAEISFIILKAKNFIHVEESVNPISFCRRLLNTLHGSQSEHIFLVPEGSTGALQPARGTVRQKYKFHKC
jgi:hypothetical protein